MRRWRPIRAARHAPGAGASGASPTSNHDLTAADWTALQQAWAGCAYCGSTNVALQRDCVLPISRGGRYTIDNVVPACPGCNASKCNAEVTSWMRRKRLDERTFLVRHAEIVAQVRTA